MSYKSDVNSDRLEFEWSLLPEIMTTGPAGGLTKPYKGIIPASADTRPEADCQSHSFPDCC